jgi:hypothetical protein
MALHDNVMHAQASQQSSFVDCCVCPLCKMSQPCIDCLHHSCPTAGQELLLAQSYAKNMGLYGERVGALSVVCKW